VIALIKPEQFQTAFLDWIAALTATNAESTEPKFIPVDGKTVRGSGGGSSRDNPLHIVSAWATEQGMTLGQVAVDSKSNEITAIPKLLEMLELKNAIVSIDAMGCQKKIAKQIVDNDGDYVLAVKDNHPKLAQAISDFFMDRCDNEDFVEFGCRKHEVLEEKSRGRRESRFFTMAPIPESLKRQCRAWKGIKSIGQAITATTHADGRETGEVRYFISSREPRVKEFARSVRGHWSIESMHWVLDVVFSEDASQLKNGHATQNYAFLRKFVISLLKRDTSKGSLKNKRKKAAWSVEFLENILFG
jgi:predicted transposase YbfD/YdcC